MSEPERDATEGDTGDVEGGDAAGDREDPADDAPREPFALETDGGETVYADPLDGDRGTEGAFLAVYRTPERARRYGWYCAACEGLDVAMDTMGRVECNRCGNLRKPTEWDAAHE